MLAQNNKLSILYLGNNRNNMVTEIPAPKIENIAPIIINKQQDKKEKRLLRKKLVRSQHYLLKKNLKAQK